LRRRNLTQRAFAAELGISEAHLSAVLSGHDSPSLDLAVRIEDITGIPARAFAEIAVGRL
jgi:transcriptional regulator with XRE-family HTH domain